MANVEEMLEGFDWSLEGSGQHSTAEAVAGRLNDELNALDAANIHAFLESDDRISAVLRGIDEAVGELNEMDSHLASYKMQLNGVTEDIGYIESLNRGLQVQTSNQKALLSELELLLTNMQVDNDSLRVLTQGSLETDKGIESLEFALGALYRALLSSRDTNHGDMAATMQHVREYETHNRQFCTRLIDYLLIMFRFQVSKKHCHSMALDADLTTYTGGYCASKCSKTSCKRDHTSSLSIRRQAWEILRSYTLHEGNG